MMSQETDPCSRTCLFDPILRQAQEDFENQPSLIVEVSFTGDDGSVGTIYVSRGLTEEQRAEMIRDPREVIESAREQVSQTGCDFIKSGRCALATCVITQAVRRPIN